MKLPDRRILYSLALFLAIAVVIALIILKGPLAPVEVKTTHLRTGDLQPAVFGIGTVEARRSYNIGFTRAGRLLSLEVDQGDRVKRGQLLGKMDPVDLPQRIRSAGLLLQKAEHQIIAAQAALNEARERARQAEKEMLRYRELAKRRQVSQETADNRATDARAAKEKVTEAEANLDGVKHDYERMQADVEALKRQLAELDLISPADGLITARNVEPGSVVTAGLPVLNMIEPQSLWVQIRVDQALSGSISTGQPVDIELRSQPGRILHGKVSRLEIVADALTEERLIDASFDEVPQRLSVGMLANATIHLPEVKQANWLPTAAIVYRRDQPGVWAVTDNKASFLPVSIGVQTLDGKTRILDGLDQRQAVVVYAAKPLRQNLSVKPAPMEND